VQAAYSGDANYNPAKASTTISVAPVPVPSIPVTLSVTSSAATVVQDTSVTLTAGLLFSNTTLSPSGTIVFYANGTALTSLPVSANGASLTLSTLPVGTDQITASYSGDAEFESATTTSATGVTVTPLSPAFTLSSPAALTVVRGQTGFATISAQANATFSGTVSFTCSGTPTAETTCTVSPASVTLAPGQSGSISVALATTQPNDTAVAGMYAGGVLACVFLPFFRRRFNGKLKGMVLPAILLAMTLAGALATTGCSGGVKYPGTPLGTQTLTITGTSGSGSSAISTSTSVTLNVTQ
jgi:hypothetical protein